MDNNISSPIELLQELERSSLGNLLDDTETISSGSWQGFVFSVYERQFAVPFAGAFEIVPCGELAPIPMAKSWVRGVTNVRGEIYTVVDFPGFMGEAPVRTTRGCNLLLLPDVRLRSALLIEGRVGLSSFREDMIEADPETFPEGIRPFLERVIGDGDKTWGVLNVDELSHSHQFLDISG